MSMLPDIHEPKNPPIPEPLIRVTLETLWLNYYNRELFKEGAISEQEYRIMARKIREREGSVRKGRQNYQT